MQNGVTVEEHQMPLAHVLLSCMVLFDSDMQLADHLCVTSYTVRQKEQA